MSGQLRQFFIGVMHASLIVAAVAVLMHFITPAKATGDWWENHFKSDPPARKPEVRSWRHVPPRIVIVRPTVTKPEPFARCKPFVTAIGDSARSEEAARLEAQKMWKATVSFQFGSKFLDLANAEFIEYQCGPTTVPSFGGRIENAIGKVLPITNFTCTVSAQACAPSIIKDHGGK